MNQEEIKVTLTFLERVQLQGKEVQAFNVIVAALQKDYAYLESIKPAEPIAEPAMVDAETVQAPEVKEE